MRTRVSAFAAAAVLLAAAPATAAFHFIHVKEVFAGSAAHPNAQYIVVQAYSGGQNDVEGHSILTFDAAGAPTGTFPFPAPAPPLPNGANQMTILIATTEAAALFNVTADLTMTPVLSPAGGKVCWEGSTPDDCFAWGSYTGSATGVGTPFNAAGGLIPSYAARRRLDICLNPVNLDACDDTSDSANDFITVQPAPVNNNGDHGQTPPATCGNNTLEGLEGCDDGDTEDGDGCSAVCRPEPAELLPGGLAVDAVVLTPDTSNANGVFEPNETVRIDPTWTVTGASTVALTGQLTNFTGLTTASPPYPGYLVSDGAAGYGTLTFGDPHSCDPASDCYRIGVGLTGARPAHHWDATADEILTGTPVGQGAALSPGVWTWTLHLGNSFADVPSDTPTPHPFYAFIENLFHNEITGGCGGINYCPGDPVTRAQMAVFLLKASLGADYLPPPCTGLVFDDVPCTVGNIYDPWIEDLAARGITAGCSPENYCPTNPVTREQMAAFLLKSLIGSTYDPPDCTQVFDDVPCTPGVGFSDWIGELFARQITGGCSATPPLYCPGAPNERGQMAVFLVKTFELLLYGLPAGNP